MEMKRHRARLVAAGHAVGQHAVPELRVAGAAGLADVQPFVEVADSIEHLAPEGHARAGADLPRAEQAASVGRRELLRVEVAPQVAAAEAPVGLEVALRFGGQLARQHEAGHGRNLRCVERRHQAFEPRRVQQHVVVGVGDESTTSRARAPALRAMSSPGRSSRR